MTNRNRYPYVALKWVGLSPQRTPIRVLVLTACVLGSLLFAAPMAGAANCGKELINEYFSTGHLKYHTQECYASALKQVDPDARMYSGIMGALRASRARDNAADNKPAAPVIDPGTTTSSVPAPPVDPVPVTTPEASTPTAQSRSGAVVPAQAAQATQAALPTVTTPSQVPLSVILLAGLAIVLTLVGLGSLTVRWLDRSS